MQNPKSGFSLMELMAVVVIISILVAMGVPLYNRTREKAIDQEAKSSLSVVLAAERIFRARYGWYYPGPPGMGGQTITDIFAINNNLGVNLDESYWDYSVFTPGFGGAGGPPANLWVYAVRQSPNGGFDRTWEITDVTTEPTCSGDCP